MLSNESRYHQFLNFHQASEQPVEIDPLDSKFGSLIDSFKSILDVEKESLQKQRDEFNKAKKAFATSIMSQ